MVTRTGKIIPSASFCVLALNCLQKSMMFTPWGPSAVPTGGAGVALPAANSNLMVFCTFFGAMFSLPQNFPGGITPPLQERLKSAELFDACKIEFNRRGAPENRDGNLEPAVIVVNLFDRAVEIREWAVDDAHLLVAFVNHFRLRTILRGVHAVDDRVHFGFRKRRRRSGRADKAGDPRRVAHDVPGVFVQIHFHQHVARIRHARSDHFLAAAHFDDVFRGNQHAADFVLQAEGGHTALQAFLDLLLEARIRVNDVPLHRHKPFRPLDVKILEQPIETKLRELLDNGEKHAEKGDGGDNDAGGGNYVFTARPGDLLHLDANVVEKLLGAFDGTGYFFAHFGSRPGDCVTL